MWEKIGNFLKGQIVTSIIYIALGCCLAFMPVDTIDIICKFVFGILLILVGAYHIIIYVAEKLNATILDLFAGGVLLVLGGFLFMNPQIVVKLLPTLLGTFVLVDSIWTLKGSLKLKKRGRGIWKLLLLGSIVFIGLGIALIAYPFTMVKYTVMFAGWVFLCNGVVDLVFMIILRKGLKELKQDVEAVESEGRIIEDQAEPFSQAEPQQEAKSRGFRRKGTQKKEQPAAEEAETVTSESEADAATETAAELAEVSPTEAPETVPETDDAPAEAPADNEEPSEPEEYAPWSSRNNDSK